MTPARDWLRSRCPDALAAFEQAGAQRLAGYAAGFGADTALPRPPQAPPPVRGAPSVPGGGPHLPGPGFCGIGKSPEPKPCADPARSPHARMHQPF